MSNFKMRSLDILVVIIINFKVCSLLDMNDTIGSTEKWGLCNAQCEVLCMESKENCECSGYSKNTVWMFRCSHNTTDCLVGSCSNFGFQEGYIPKVPNISTVRNKTDVILRWNMDSTSLHVIYIIQRRWTELGDWETVGWSSNNTFTVNVGCRAPYTRIASVSKFGSRFFSNPVKVPDMYIGPVQNLTAASIKYDNKTDEIRIKFRWNPPRGWKHSQIRIYQWSSYPILKGCPDLNWQRHRVYFDSQIPNGFITARIPSYLKDCNLTLQVKADPHCTFQTHLLAEYANFSLNCTMVDNLACSPKPYNPPGNVHEVKVILIPTQTSPRARITWEPPTDLGSSDHIDRYWIAWGILDDKQPDNIFGLSQNLIDVKHIAVPGTQLFTEFYLPPNITNTTMGIQIMACGPGHVITENGWVSPIISIPRAAIDEYFKFKDQLLSDTDGFIVVKIPNHSSVRVYWRLNENHHQLKRYKFRWGKFVNYELKPENATDLDTDTNANLKQFKHLVTS